MLPLPSVETTLALWLGVVVASILRSFTGFGFGLTAIPFFVVILTPIQSAVLSVALTFSVGLFGIKPAIIKQHTQHLLVPLLFAFLGTIAGTYTLLILDVTTFKLLVGLMIVLLCTVMEFAPPMPKLKSKTADALAGLLSGLGNGATGIPGMPVIPLWMLTEQNNAFLRGKLMVYFTYTALFGLMVFSVNQLVTPQLIGMYLVCLPVMVFGTYIGSSLFQKASGNVYRKTAVFVLACIGFSCIITVF